MLRRMLLGVLLWVSLAGTPARIAVVDVSAPDAVYEDVSRELAEHLVEELSRQGLAAVRVDESELPAEGCRFGPCLEKVARAQQADAVVTIDAVELDKRRTGVAVTALAGKNGAPLAGGRWTVEKPGESPKSLRAFVKSLVKELARRAPRDGGAP